MNQFNSIDLENNFKITYYEIDRIDDDIIITKDRGKYGFMRLSSKTLVPAEIVKPKFTSISKFNNGFAICCCYEGSQTYRNIIDKDGNLILKDDLFALEYLGDNIYEFDGTVLGNAKFFTLEDKENTIVSNINSGFQLVKRFDSGSFIVRENQHQLYLFVSPNGVVDYYAGICLINNDQFIGRKRGENESYIYDNMGNKVKSFNYSLFGNNTFANCFKVNDYKLCLYDYTSKWDFTNINGDVIKSLNYFRIEPPQTNSNLMRICDNCKYGFIDLDGNEVYEPIFTSVTPFYDGVAAYNNSIHIDSYECGLIDTVGNTILKKYGYKIEYLNNGTFLLSDLGGNDPLLSIFGHEHKDYIIDKQGNVLLKLDANKASILGKSYKIINDILIEEMDYLNYEPVYEYHMIVDSKDNDSKSVIPVNLYKVEEVVKKDDLILIKSKLDSKEFGHSKKMFRIFNKYGDNIIPPVIHENMFIINNEFIIVDNRIVPLNYLKINYHYLLEDDNDQIVTFNDTSELNKFINLYLKRYSIINLLKLKKQLYSLNKEKKLVKKNNLFQKYK